LAHFIVYFISKVGGQKFSCSFAVLNFLALV